MDEKQGEQELDRVLNAYDSKIGENMSIEVIKNRKGEKILKVQGFKDIIVNEQYGNEGDEDDEEQTLFVNLNRLCQGQKRQKAIKN